MGVGSSSKSRKKGKPSSLKQEAPPVQEPKKKTSKRTNVRFALAEGEDFSDTEEEILKRRREKLQQRRGTEFNKIDLDDDDEDDDDSAKGEKEEEHNKENNNELKISITASCDSPKSGDVEFDLPNKEEEEADDDEEVIRARREKLQKRRGTKFNRTSLAMDSSDEETEDESTSTDGVQFNDTDFSEAIDVESNEEVLRRREKINQRRGTKFVPASALEDSDEEESSDLSSFRLNNYSHSASNNNQSPPVLTSNPPEENSNDEDVWSKGSHNLNNRDQSLEEVESIRI